MFLCAVPMRAPPNLIPSRFRLPVRWVGFAIPDGKTRRLGGLGRKSTGMHARCLRVGLTADV